MKTYEKKYKRQKQYVTGIDGLRAIAVLMVFAYHLRLPFARGGRYCIFCYIGIPDHADPCIGTGEYRYD